MAQFFLKKEVDISNIKIKNMKKRIKNKYKGSFDGCSLRVEECSSPVN